MQAGSVQVGLPGPVIDPGIGVRDSERQLLTITAPLSYPRGFSGELRLRATGTEPGAADTDRGSPGKR